MAPSLGKDRSGLMHSHLTNSSASRRRALKHHVTWLWEEEYTEDNRLARLVLPKAPRKLTEILSGEEMADLLAAIDLEFVAGTREDDLDIG